jgi:uncharacterized membrane protein
MKPAQNSSEVYSAVGSDALSDFSNGVFGFAATLLITTITLPAIAPAHIETQLPTELMGLWPNIVAYILSFLNISSYWKLHSFTLMHVRLVDNKLVFLNILFLLSVTFLPLPTALMGKYGRLPLTNFIYGATLTVNYLFLFLTAFYAYKQRLVKSEPPFPAVLLLKKKLLFPLFAAILGTGFSLIYPRLSFLFYTVVILTHLIPFRHQEVVQN